MANPTANEAIDQCFVALRLGAAPATIPTKVLKKVREHFVPKFTYMLGGSGGGKWNRDAPNVLRTAYYMGNLAGCFAFGEARGKGDETVTEVQMFEAIKIVGAKCPARARDLRFKYCEDPPKGRKARRGVVVQSI